MQFDLFTFLASLFNFLVLLALLRIFLFKRVTKAMDAREQRIHDNWDEAESEKQEAKELRAEYEQKMDDAEDERHEMLEKAREEIDRERRSRLDEAREEVDAKRKEWLEALQSEQQRLVRRVREQVVNATVESTRSALASLAGRSLELQMVERLLDRIADQDGDLAEAIGGARVEVTTSSELSNDERERIESRLREAAEPAGIEFETSDELVCGLRMRIDDREIGWSIVDHMARVEAEIGELVEAK